MILHCTIKSTGEGSVNSFAIKDESDIPRNCPAEFHHKLWEKAKQLQQEAEDGIFLPVTVFLRGYIVRFDFIEE